MGGLSLVPVSLREANAIVDRLHRHHKPVRGCKFCVSVVDGGGVVRGVAIAGRPVARALDDGKTIEVLRVATDGASNACSMLYSSLWRASRAIGYHRGITYTLESECGVSLRAAGWTPTLVSPGGSWSCPSRPREDKAPTCKKQRWEVLAKQAGKE